MTSPGRRRFRLLPLLYMGLAVALLTWVALSFGPSLPRVGQSPFATAGQLSPSGAPLAPGPTAAASVTGTPGPSAAPSASGTPVPSAAGSLGPTASAVPAAATRIRVPALGIDLPIVPGDLEVPGNPDFYPLCDVAMYLTQYEPPGIAGTTYVYAHAQRGMFLPLLDASEIADGAALIGTQVEVYAADGRLHLYEIDLVKRHATDLSIADTEPRQHQLVLQTSEGPTGTIPKLQVSARPISVSDVEQSTANPIPQPRVCAPT